MVAREGIHPGLRLQHGSESIVAAAATGALWKSGGGAFGAAGAHCRGDAATGGVGAILPVDITIGVAWGGGGAVDGGR